MLKHLGSLGTKLTGLKPKAVDISSMRTAGFGLVSIFNVFLILALGVADEEVRAPTSSIRSAYSGSACAPLA